VQENEKRGSGFKDRHKKIFKKDALDAFVLVESEVRQLTALPGSYQWSKNKVSIDSARDAALNKYGSAFGFSLAILNKSLNTGDRLSVNEQKRKAVLISQISSLGMRAICGDEKGGNDSDDENDEEEEEFFHGGGDIKGIEKGGLKSQ